MKLRLIILGICLCLAVVFTMNHLRKPAQPAAPSGPSRRDLARAEVLENCTNEIPGISRIVSLNYDDAGANVSDWRAAVTVDYVNALGGVERTNLAFRFEGFGSGIICLPDRGK